MNESELPSASRLFGALYTFLGRPILSSAAATLGYKLHNLAPRRAEALGLDGDEIAGNAAG
eukprot:scaffold1638_cov258-Pinguiococcus_pyrenoidosus.AAC.77